VRAILCFDPPLASFPAFKSNRLPAGSIMPVKTHSFSARLSRRNFVCLFAATDVCQIADR
jgi:hypothetical protein